MNITDLPDELLVEIFSYLSDNKYFGRQRNLLRVTEVCKRFNEIVGNSQKLMQNIKVVWRNDDHDDLDTQVLLESNRRYTRIKYMVISGLFKDISDCFIAFLEQQTSIKYLELYYSTFKQAEFVSILNSVRETIQDLEINELELTDKEMYVEPLFFPSLSRLYWQDSVNMDFGLFKVSEKFQEFQADTDYQDLKNCMEFLINARGLKKLCLDRLYIAVAQQIFETSRLSEQARFKLEELDIVIFSEFFYMDSTHVSNLTKFIKTQSLLKKVKLSGLALTDDLLEAIIQVPTLMNLDLEVSKYRNYRNISVKSTSVRVLRMWFNPGEDQDSYDCKIGICQVIKGFPHVTEVEFSEIDITEEVTDAIIKHMKNLRSIRFDFDPLYNSIPKEVVDNIIKVLRANPQFLRITLPHQVKSLPEFREIRSLFDINKVAIYC